MRFAWIPEAPDHPGLYANLLESKRGSIEPSTVNAEYARQFGTFEDCQAWCDANPVPVFVPREHGFDEA